MVNLMEENVKRTLEDVLKAYDCCKCERCQMDMMALALNKLPPHYVVCDAGEAMTRYNMSLEQSRAELIVEVIRAVETVAKNPRHP